MGIGGDDDLSCNHADDCLDDDSAVQQERTINSIAIVSTHWIFESVESQEQDDCTLPDRVEVPPPKVKLVEAFVLQSKFVATRVVQQELFSMLPIKRTIPNNWTSSHENVESLVHVVIVNSSSWELWLEAEVENGQHVQYILVKQVQHQVGVASVGFSPVHEQQVL